MLGQLTHELPDIPWVCLHLTVEMLALPAGATTASFICPLGIPTQVLPLV